MPTVKKRTDNDGYLKLISKAPDMENSTDVLFTPKPMRKKPSAAKALTERKPRAPKKLAPPTEELTPIEEIAPVEPIAPVAQTATAEIELVPDITKETEAEPTSPKTEPSCATVIANLHDEVKRVMIKEEGGSSYVNLGRDMPVHLL